MKSDRDAHPEPHVCLLRTCAVGLAVLATAAAAMAGADAPAKPGSAGWRTSRQVLLPGLIAPTMVYLPLDDHALAGVRNDNEYRILDAKGVEVPYRMLAERGETVTYALDTTTIYNSPPAARPQEIVLDARVHPASALVMHLSLSGAKQAIVASVDGSADRREWRRLGQAKAAPAPGSTVDSIAVNVNRQADRYYRVQVASAGAAIPKITLDSLNVETPVERVAVAVPAAVSIHSGEGNATIVELDPGKPVRDLNEIELRIDESSFDRPVSYEESENGRDWTPSGLSYRMAGETGLAGQGRIKRLAGSEPIRLMLDNPGGYYQPSARRMRLLIQNGNDRPLTIRKAELFRCRRGLLFHADPSRQYSLVYGTLEDFRTPRPDYEIERMPLLEPPSRLPLASLGPAQELPAPWSERHPALLWSALGIVVILLLGVILRAMRSAARSAGGGEPGQDAGSEPPTSSAAA